MRISLIAAMTTDHIIGHNGALPWHFPEDLKRFRMLTLGHCVLMGRKTFESLGRPLSKRRNLIVSRHGKPNTSSAHDDAEWFMSVPDAIQAARTGGETELFIVGGGKIYAATLPMADRLYITIVHPDQPVSGDTWFPEWNVSQWNQTERIQSTNLEFLTLDRMPQRAP